MGATVSNVLEKIGEDWKKQLGVVNPRVNHNSCNALVILQDRGYLHRNIKNTSTRETVSVHNTVKVHSNYTVSEDIKSIEFGLGRNIMNSVLSQEANAGKQIN